MYGRVSDGVVPRPGRTSAARDEPAILSLTGIALAACSVDAHAQKLPWIVVPLAALPLVALFLSLVVGIVCGSWRAGLGNAALAILWTAWFVVSARSSMSDPLTWVPAAALALHTLAMAGG